jgi:simple sugar transport system ATP-binding protein
MKGIVKKFPGLVANDQIDLDVRKGEVHALLGENGAGKSTLMNVLSGLYQADAGKIYIRGRQVSIASPQKAIELGIGTVYQHFMLVPAMTAIENIILGLRSEHEPWLQIKEARAKIIELSQRYGLSVRLDTVVAEFSVGERQRLEIIKALYRGAEIMILDEPTAVLTPDESRNIFKLIRQLTGEGLSVIFISHKLKEIMEISDRVTILRQGKKIATVDTRETSPQVLAKMMVGREVIFSDFVKRLIQDRPVLVLEGVSCAGSGNYKQLHDITLTANAGEILGVAGVDGNGQSELSRVVVGMLPVSGGRVLLGDQDLTGKPVIDYIRMREAFIPEDRITMGLAGTMSVAENMVLKTIGDRPFSSWGGWKVNYGHVKKYAEELAEKFDVRGSGLTCAARDLSGGNQQKVILARELAQDPVFLVAVHPTRGLDVGATDFVHREIINARDHGAAVLLISSDLDEVLRLSDRIACLYEGEIMGIVDGEHVNIDRIGLMMAGSRILEEDISQ